MSRTSAPPRRDLYEIENEKQTTMAEKTDTNEND
jgi:hypothetical protein